MTDAELIELLETKATSEWTEAEVDLLRLRVRESPEVRLAVAEAIRLDQALAEKFSAVNLSVEAILAAARNTQPRERHLSLWRWGFGTALLLVAATILYLVTRPQPEAEKLAQTGEIATPDAVPVPDRKPAEVAANTPAKTPEPVDKPEDKPVTEPTPAPVASVPTPPTVAPSVTPVAVVPPTFPELTPQAPRVAQAALLSDQEPSGLGKSELQRWLEPAEKDKAQFNETQRHDTRVAAFEGMVRLKAPWGDDSVLRIAPFDQQGLVLYFWTGETGVALVHYQPRGRLEWAAYLVTRKPGELRPSTWVLAATDNGVYERLSRPPLDLRHQDGRLLVQRGAIRLLSAPLAAKPVEVFLERKGWAWFRAFRMFRGEPHPSPVAPERPVVVELNRPVDLDWTTRLSDGAYWYPSLEGPVELKSEKSNQPARADFPLPVRGLMEYLVEVRSPTAGTGVFVAGESGEPVGQLAFFENRATKSTSYGLLPVGQKHDHVHLDVQQQVAPNVGERHWFKLVVGAGVFKAWGSVDGVEWTRLPEATVPTPRGKTVTRLGLFCLAGKEPRRITLERVLVREVAPLVRLADLELRSRVPARVIAHDGEYGAWLALALGSQPAGVPLEAWLRAAGVATLANGPRGPVANDILHGLLGDAIQRLPGLEERLAVLAAGAELLDGWNYQYAIRQALLYEALGQVLLKAGETKPYSAVATSLFTVPLWTETVFDSMPASLVRAELIGQIYRGEWAGVEQTARQVEYWNESGPPEYRWEHHRPGFRPLVAWSLAASIREQPEKPRGKGQPAFPSQWRHPLVQDLSKEGFNTLAEVRVALAEKSYRDACQIITSARPDLALGLVPDSVDPGLLVSLPQSIAVAMRDEPELARVMNDEFARLGKFRVQQAIRDGNFVAVKGATVQFFGTDAARMAHTWLGDRALAGGEFSAAIREYQRGLLVASEAARDELSPRLRLAGAFLGRDEERPAVGPLQFQERKFSADEFERMVTQVREKARAGATRAVGDPEPSVAAALVAPARYEVQARAKWAGELGHGAGNPANGMIDWTARQLAVVQTGERLIVSNRYQIAAVSLATGQIEWTQGLGGEIGHAHRFPLTPMRPVVAGERIYARRLTKDGPQLVCLKLADGQPVWQVRPGDVLSDPMLVQGRILALVAGATSDGTQQAGLAEFDPETGAARGMGTLVRFHDLWDRQVPAAMTVAGNRLVGFIGGTTVCCDLSGQPLWLRKATWLPPAQDSSQYEIQGMAPLVEGERVYVLQAGVRAVECLDLSTGRRQWVRGLVDPRRMLGIAGERLVVETDGCLAGLDVATGGTVWRTAAGNWLDGFCLDAGTGDLAGAGAGGAVREGRLLATRRELVQQDQWRPVLVWLDVATGRELAASPLEGLTDRDPQFGPIVVVKDRLWAFSGKGQREASRELVELLPGAGSSEPLSAPAERLALAELGPWRHVSTDQRLQWGLSAVLPGWFCVQGAYDPRAGYRAEHLGQKGLAGIVTHGHHPTILAGRWALDPAGQRPLTVRVGQEGNEVWRLRVLVGGNVVAEESIGPATTTGGWREVSVSLPAPVLANFAREEGGERFVPVVLEAVPDGNGAAATYWR